MASILDKAKAAFGGTSAAAPASEDRDLQESVLLVLRLKNEALQQADRAAQNDQRQPTLSDYFIAAHKLGITNREALQKHQIPWGPRIYSDLSGLKITGFLIREGEISPSADIRQQAMQLANEEAAKAGRKASLPDFLNAVRIVNDMKEGGVSSRRVIQPQRAMS
jgi:hypothetical protein